MKADEWSEIQISLRFLDPSGDGVTSDSDLDRVFDHYTDETEEQTGPSKRPKLRSLKSSKLAIEQSSKLSVKMLTVKGIFTHLVVQLVE